MSILSTLTRIACTAALLLTQFPAAHAASTPATQDFWHTQGSRILDAHNHPVRISGMNWSGFETTHAIPGGLDAQDYRTILRTIKDSGYNTVRIPFSNQMVETPSVPRSIRFSNHTGPINTDLRNLSSLQILDRIVAYSGQIGLKVILDNHRSEAGSSAQESGLWYTARFPESSWINDWTTLAHRYENTSTVIGMDLRNEPHNAGKGGACWDCGGPNDWHRAAERAGNAVLAVNPRLLIFVEGVDAYAGDFYWWGGNLEGVRNAPVHLTLPNHLVYSAHEYGPTEYAQSWFNSASTPASLAAIWRRHWAYISEAGIAPVWIGEFGTPNNDADIHSTLPGSEGQWFTSLVDFLANHPDLGWTYWGVNGEDRYGLLDSAYSRHAANPLKAEALASIAGDPNPSLTASAALEAEPASFPCPLASCSASTQLSQPTTIARSPEPNQPAASHPRSRRELHPLNDTEASAIQSAIAASVHQATSMADLSLTR